MTDGLPLAGTVVLVRDGAATVEVLILRRPARGSFADAWVFPGGLVEDGDRTEGGTGQDAARAAAARECAEEVGLHPVDLVPLSRWIPPAQAPKRVGTWFFLAADPGGAVVPSPDEVVDWRWIGPVEALERHAAGDIELFPPTWVTLHGLVGYASAAEALAAASDAPTFATRLLPGDVFCWAGDARHPDGGEGVHRLETAVRPWRYRRD
ncbi:NUDIX domain-containing protein [Microbacterium sp. CIAB417]|uniref:NUDIX domain-containing protein n=1 Tax=Microbacterium sp. CIAB417 TaxID=2860287 RepID=UPI001FAC954F|nr:NUDIX domain-containing protein [Microbacterium sp. CIAB417]